MKKKLFSLLLIAVMVLSSFSAVFAQDQGTDAEGKGTITISNPAKGEKYGVVKIFDATVTSGDPAAGITYTYTGELPATLATVFQKDAKNYVTPKEGVSEEAIATAVKNYLATLDKATIATVESDGTALNFKGLDYGYYGVLSTQGTAVTIDSTMPNVTVTDKNSKEPSLTKTIDDDNVNIGDTVTYTVSTPAPNYLADPDNAEGTPQKVVSYNFTDTLPAFISDVKIISITVTDGDGAHEVFKGEKAFTGSDTITVDWVENGVHKYKNDAVIEIKYTAKVTAQATESNAGVGNVNIVTMKPKVDKGNGPEDYKKEWKDDAVTYTYAAALKKTDGNTNAALPGATFHVKGLTVSKIADGEYMVVSKDASSTATYIDGQEMTVGANGELIIHGLASDEKLTVKETIAPNGYNPLNEEFEVTPVVCSKEIVRTTTIQYFKSRPQGSTGAFEIEKTVESTETEKIEYNNALVAASSGNVVKNYKGTELPSTGGIGTTIIYILGAALVIGAGVMLVTRKKMND